MRGGEEASDSCWLIPELSLKGNAQVKAVIPDPTVQTSLLGAPTHPTACSLKRSLVQFNGRSEGFASSPAASRLSH